MNDFIDFGAAPPPKPGETPQTLPVVLVPEIEVTLPPAQIYDTSVAAQTCLELKSAVEQAQKDSKLITLIRDEATNATAVSIAAQAKSLHKKLEAMRKHFVNPHYDYKKKVDTFFKFYTDPLEEMERRLARLISNFALFQENERKRQQAEMEARAKAVAEEQTREAAEAAEKGVFYTPVEVATPVAPPVSTVTRTTAGSASQSKHWTHEIVDEAKIPRKYLVVDERLIRQDIKGGVREIDGVRIFQDSTTKIRTI